MNPEVATLREAFNELIRPELQGRTVEDYDGAVKVWERLTGNPPLATISNATVAGFRQSMIDAEYAPATINGTWAKCRITLRRCGPPMYKNPWGMSLIPAVPAMKAVPETRRFPRVFRLDELGALYGACETRIWPDDGGVPPTDWWRALLLLTINAGPRPGDLFRLTPESIDWDLGTVKFLQSKVRAWHFVPLTEATRLHLERIRSDREFLFPGGRETGRREFHRESNAFYRNWRELLNAAGVPFARFYTLRKTCATYWDRIERGLGAYVLGHSLERAGTAACYYLNVTDDLFAAAKQLPQPEAFTRIVSDPKLQRNVVCRSHGVRRTDWEFTASTARFRDGETFRLPPRVLRTLQVLVAAGGRPVAIDDLLKTVFWDQPAASRTTVKTTVVRLRRRLIDTLSIGPYTDPLPCPGNAGYALRVT